MSSTPTTPNTSRAPDHPIPHPTSQTAAILASLCLLCCTTRLPDLSIAAMLNTAFPGADLDDEDIFPTYADIAAERPEWLRAFHAHVAAESSSRAALEMEEAVNALLDGRVLHMPGEEEVGRPFVERLEGFMREGGA